jgi:hypothetical protein
MKSTITLFIISIALLGISPSKSFACSPSPDWPPTLQENYKKHTHIFAGSVIAVTEDTENNTVAITFDPLSVAKGSGEIIIHEPFTVTTASSSATCGYDNSKSTFAEGSLWVIYTNESKTIDSLSLNKKVSTLEEAKNLLVEGKSDVSSADIAEEKGVGEAEDDSSPIFCTADYAPVCGQIDTGIRCITTPCPSFEEKTYSNKCTLSVAKATFLYEGECKESSEKETEKEITATPPKEQKEVPSKVSEEKTPTAEEIIKQIKTIEEKIETLEDTDLKQETTKDEEIGFFSKVGNFLKKIFFFWK